MTLEEANTLAQEQANEFGLVMIVVRDDLSEDPGGNESCAELHRYTVHFEQHKEFWKIEGRCEPR